MTETPDEALPQLTADEREELRNQVSGYVAALKNAAEAIRRTVARGGLTRLSTSPIIGGAPRMPGHRSAGASS